MAFVMLPLPVGGNHQSSDVLDGAIVIRSRRPVNERLLKALELACRSRYPDSSTLQAPHYLFVL